jgi:RND family efflux transporter MFP subunit
MRSIGLTTGTVELKQVADDISATGTVVIDDRLVSYVQVRFPGYIRKVFANATYQYVRKGQPLFTMYSPELAATQQEYLMARKDAQTMASSSVDGVAAGAGSLAAAAEQRLRQYDISDAQIARMQTTGKVATDLTIDAPSSGYITDYAALPNLYVQPSTRLYTLADLSRVWVNAQIFQNDLGRIRSGESATLTVDSYPGRTFTGRVELILPQLELATRTGQVRLEVANPGIQLKPGMFVNVTLKSPQPPQLVVPASAVFQTGSRQVVFLNRGNGQLEPKDVTLGPRFGDDYVILSGLKLHDEVITSANFLLDSESQLQAAAGAPATATGAPATAASAAGPTQSTVNVDFTSDPSPARKGANTFHVKLTDAKGQPVTGAQVSATFYMAAMPAMGMAALKAETHLNESAAGIYAGDGALPSGGTWQVTIVVTKAGRTLASKQLRLNATGGM